MVDFSEDQGLLVVYTPLFVDRNQGYKLPPVRHHAGIEELAVYVFTQIVAFSFHQLAK